MPLTSPDRAALEHGDLEDTHDLIPPSATAAASNGNGSYSNGSNGAFDPSKPSLSSSSSSSPLDLITNAGYALCSAVSYAYAYAIYSYHHRRTEFVLACILLLCSVLALSGKLGGGGSGRSSERGYHNPAILHDWSQISSALDLKLGSIDHWCLRGGDDECRCEDPLMPSARSDTKRWGAAHGKNKKAIVEAVQERADAVAAAQAAADAAAGKGWSSGLYENDLDDGVEWYEDGYQDDWTFDETDYGALGNDGTGTDLPVLDVVFLGDSITEQRAGKFFGKETERFSKAAHVFTKAYSRDAGGKYDGLALGIAGDTAPNLLWRILHGEMPDDLNPRIWWITIGTNDLGATQCSEEVTLLGILRVVEEILNRKPEAHIVINSILPMAQEKSGILEINGKRPGRGRRGRKKKKGGAATDFWPSIKAVNKQLQKFADKHKSVKYFDATDIFTERVGNRLVIDHDLIEDGVHPTPAGYKKWDAEIIKRIDSIESKDDDGKKKAAADAADAKAAADAAAAEKQQADMDAAAADDLTDDAYDSYDQGYDDFYIDDLTAAANWDGNGDDNWLYAGQDTDDW